MKKNLKRLCALMMACALILGLLAGCGSEAPAEPASVSAAVETPVEDTTVEEVIPAEEAPDEATSAEEATEEAAPATERVEVPLPISEETVSFTFWTTQNPRMSAYLPELEDNPAYVRMEELTNIHLDMQYSAAESSVDNFAIMIASGDWCDIVVNGLNYYTAGADASIEEEVFMDLTELVESSIPNYTAVIEKYDVAKDVITDAGYMAAFYGVRDQEQSQRGLVVRQDYLDELGLAAPVTIDDYTEVLTAMKNEYGAAFGLAPSGVSGTSFVSAYGVAGEIEQMAGEIPFFIDYADGAVKFGPIQEGYKQYLELMHSWYDEGLVYNDFLNANGISYPSDIVTTGKVGIFGLTQASLHQYDEAGLENDPDFALTALTAPVLNEGDIDHFADITPLVASEGWSVTTTCENLDILASYINYWYSEDGSLVASYGVEDSSFVYDENGNPLLTELVTGHEVGVEAAIYLYCIETGPFEIAYSRLDPSFTEAQRNAKEIWMQNRDTYSSMPSLALSAEDGTTYNAIMGDVLSIVNEWTLKFIVGDADLDAEWDSYVESIENLDIATAVEIQQEAVTRYTSR